MGNANLFLINPNGIIFGPNASLDVRGSFVTTSANAIGFGDRGSFSASDPNIPPLLTVNPSAFLFNQVAGPITNQSLAGIQVPNSQSLLLLGGNVSLDGGALKAPGGRVELGAVAGAGTVGLSVDGNNLVLGFPDEVTRADVSLTNGAQVDVRSGGSGSIALNARNIQVLEGSRLFAGIGSDLGSPGSQAGDITLKATEAIALGQSSSIQNRVNPNAIGNSGDIDILARSLSVTDGAFLSSSTYGQGDAGNIQVTAADATISRPGK